MRLRAKSPGTGTRAEKRAAKKVRSAGKAADKKAAKKAGEPRGAVATLTDPKTARRAIAVAKLAGPALAPLALRTSTAARELLDARRATKLGVPAEQVAAYRGPAGPALARITTLDQAVDDLRRRRGTDPQVVRFADVARTRFADLTAAARAAASMPPARRRATLRAVGKDLSQLEADLMTFLVVTSS